LIAFLNTVPLEVSRYEGSDIGAIWKEGRRICDGKNPYSRIHREGVDRIRKPPTYLPGFYLFGCALDGLGVDSFREFMPIWWKVNYALLLFLASSFYLIFKRAEMPIVGLVCMASWLFGRWGAFGLVTLQTNFAGMVPLLWSLALVEKRPRTAMVLFGISLLMKQVAIFLLPLFLLWWWERRERSSPLPYLLKGMFWMVGLPLLVSLPFFIHDASGFLKSIGYSAGRNPGGGMPFLRGIGSAATLVMFAGMALVYLGAWRREVSKLSAAALIMLCFITMNGTFFRQYLLWFLLLAPLPLLELRRFLDSKQKLAAG
jgi:uncharacterized membrane protein